MTAEPDAGERPITTKIEDNIHLDYNAIIRRKKNWIETNDLFQPGSGTTNSRGNIVSLVL